MVQNKIISWTLSKKMSELRLDYGWRMMDAKLKREREKRKQVMISGTVEDYKLNSFKIDKPR